MPLQMKPYCEGCDAELPQDGEAFICSYECSFCYDCAAETKGVCPNCSGELVARPKRTSR